MPQTKLKSFFICATLIILFTSTLIQGHDNFDVNTTDNILSSSSELENSLRQHNNPIRIDDYEYPSMEAKAFHSSDHHCGTYKSNEDIDLDEAEHKEILESLLSSSSLSSSSSSSSNLRSRKFADALDLDVLTKVNLYVHVIMNTSGHGNISNTMLQAQINVLNQDYNSLSFWFVVKSIDYTVNDRWYTMRKDSNTERLAKTALHKGTAADLNLYLTKIGDGVLGWGTYPADYRRNPKNDGVVILSTTLPGGTEERYNLGKTATHEVGHWLGLYHTFEGGCLDGDLVDDTPAEGVEHFGCIPGEVRDTCPDKPGLDPIHNYMDYSDDVCLTEFSYGQGVRAKSQWKAYRSPSTDAPSVAPTVMLSRAPTRRPTRSPSTRAPTRRPTRSPSTRAPTIKPSTSSPSSRVPTRRPTRSPSTRAPTINPSTSAAPLSDPSTSPSSDPSAAPSSDPSTSPSSDSLTAPSSGPTAAPCASGWVQYEGNCYLILPAFNSGSISGTWDQCHAYCPTSYPGATMLCVNNAAENAWMYSQYGGSWYWIGYTDMPPYGGGKGTMQYGWVTGCSSTYTNWRFDEPNNHFNNEDYAHVLENGYWNDYTRETILFCGCQYNPSPYSAPP